MAFTIKKGDNLPLLVAILKDGAAVAIDVSAAVSIKFRMRKSDAMPGVRTVNNRACALTTDGTDGSVQIELTPAETAVPGNYLGEFVIDWGGGDTQTVPSDSYVDVKITDLI